MSAQLNTITPIEEAETLFAIPHAFEITPELHAQVVAVAVERARQEMFEACCKVLCWRCEDGEHSKDISENCYAWGLRNKFPERSAAMNARATRTLALGD